MSFFTNAQGVEINGGLFTSTTVVTNNYLNGPAGIDTLRQASAPEATHDSYARTYHPRCFAGTREQYIEDITHWSIPSLGDTPPPIYWMRGPAGVGKSAIAQTCAERLQKMGALGATFFFSISGQHNPKKFFPSIAYQLSTVHPAYRDLVSTKIRHDETIVHKAMQFQFQYLIDEPLRELEQNGKGIRKRIQVFVDGLDECEGNDAQCEIIRIVAAAASDGIIPLRWAFFSRPEPHIEAMFSKAGVALHCYKTILPISRDADGEIELYLRNGFGNILERRNASIQAPWPSLEDLKTVVDATCGLFIYATTVIRFVGHPDSLGPQKRLRAIVDAILDRREHVSHPPFCTDAPFAELDTFYMLILRRVPAKIIPSIHLLLAMLCRGPIWGATAAANILGLSRDEFETACNCVNAVIRLEDPGKDLELDSATDTNLSYTQTSRDILQDLYPEVTRRLGGRISFYHKSFFDFLLDPVRSGSYCTKASEALANHFVKIHLDYDRSFCWRGSELILAPGVSNSAASLSYPYTNELVNSLLKIHVYDTVGDENPHSFPAPVEPRRLDADCDFRKRLHISTSLADINHAFSHLLWSCESQVKSFPGTQIEYISRSGFSKFNITEFKSMIKQRERANILERLYPNFVSRMKSLFPNKSQNGVESALYRMGHGEKSIFWYWEINYKLRYYRDFRAIDLSKGQKIFRGENFDLWPDDFDSESEEEDDDG